MSSFAKSKVTDMTTGSPAKHILCFALPVLIGNIFQQFYNMVDSLVVGNYVGANALAATGTCGSINFLFFALTSGLSAGIGVLVSQSFGAKDIGLVKKTIANSFYILGTSAAVATVVGISLARTILTWMGTPPEIIGDATTYLRTTCTGIIFIAIYIGVCNILRALGDSRTPLYFLILSSFINVGLDLFFVLALNMGVFGVALATVISQMVNAFVSVIYAFLKIEYFRFSKEERIVDKRIIRNCIRIGLPMAFQSSLISISLIALQSVVNSFGATVMAAYTIGTKVESVISQVYIALSQSVTNYSGQNIGAQRIDRVKQGFKSSILLTLAYDLIMIPLVFFLSPQISAFFVNESEVIAISQNALKITSIMYLGLGFIYAPRSVLNGCGDANFSLMNGVTEVAGRIIYSNVLTRIPVIGMWGIWLSAGLTWVTTAVVALLRYSHGKWQTIHLQNKIK